MNLLILREGIDPRLLELELAGRRLEEYLTINAANRFAVKQFLHTFDSAQGASLYVRGDAWFTEVALSRLADRLCNSQTATSVFVMAPTHGVLAVYLAPEEAKAQFAPFKHDAPADALTSFLDRVLNRTVIDGAELDSDFPPLRVGNLLQVAWVEKRILYERARAALLNGVRIHDPDRISIRGELSCGEGVEIDIDVILQGRVTLGDGVKVGASCILKNAVIGDNSRINPFSIVEDAVIGADSFVGPFGRIRPGSNIGDRVQIGNFVEVKNALVGSGGRINHLAFIGDATLGSDVTIGAGVITCNHDGHGVTTTQIGTGAYVGSGTELVAPISIGENAFIGAGSTITRDAPAGKLTIARSRQITVEKRPRRDRGAKRN